MDVTGISKGKGFQGVVKRHGFGGVGGQTHGQHNRQRKPGSLGASSYPSRVFKGKRLPGRTGGERVTVLNLRIRQETSRKQPASGEGFDSGCKRFVLINRRLTMEIAIYNVSGKDTGKKAVLKDEIFGIEPNNHAIYLDVKQYLANQSSGNPQVETA